MHGIEYVQKCDIIPVPVWEILPNLGQHSEFPTNLHIQRVTKINTQSNKNNGPLLTAIQWYRRQEGPQVSFSVFVCISVTN